MFSNHPGGAPENFGNFSEHIAVRKNMLTALPSVTSCKSLYSALAVKFSGTSCRSKRFDAA